MTDTEVVEGGDLDITSTFVLLRDCVVMEENRNSLVFCRLSALESGDEISQCLARKLEQIGVQDLDSFNVLECRCTADRIDGINLNVGSDDRLKLIAEVEDEEVDSGDEGSVSSRLEGGEAGDVAEPRLEQGDEDQLLPEGPENEARVDTSDSDEGRADVGGQHIGNDIPVMIIDKEERGVYRAVTNVIRNEEKIGNIMRLGRDIGELRKDIKDVERTLRNEIKTEFKQATSDKSRDMLVFERSLKINSDSISAVVQNVRRLEQTNDRNSEKFITTDKLEVVKVESRHNKDGLVRVERKIDDTKKILDNRMESIEQTLKDKFSDFEELVVTANSNNIANTNVDYYLNYWHRGRIFIEMCMAVGLIFFLNQTRIKLDFITMPSLCLALFFLIRSVIWFLSFVIFRITYIGMVWNTENLLLYLPKSGCSLECVNGRLKIRGRTSGVFDNFTFFSNILIRIFQVTMAFSLILVPSFIGRIEKMNMPSLMWDESRITGIERNLRETNVNIREMLNTLDLWRGEQDKMKDLFIGVWKKSSNENNDGHDSMRGVSEEILDVMFGDAFMSHVERKLAESKIDRNNKNAFDPTVDDMLYWENVVMNKDYGRYRNCLDILPSCKVVWSCPEIYVRDKLFRASFNLRAACERIKMNGLPNVKVNTNFGKVDKVDSIEPTVVSAEAIVTTSTMPIQLKSPIVTGTNERDDGIDHLQGVLARLTTSVINGASFLTGSTPGQINPQLQQDLASLSEKVNEISRMLGIKDVGENKTVESDPKKTSGGAIKVSLAGVADNHSFVKVELNGTLSNASSEISLEEFEDGVYLREGKVYMVESGRISEPCNEIFLTINVSHTRTIWALKHYLGFDYFSRLRIGKLNLAGIDKNEVGLFLSPYAVNNNLTHICFVEELRCSPTYKNITKSVLFVVENAVENNLKDCYKRENYILNTTASIFQYNITNFNKVINSTWFYHQWVNEWGLVSTVDFLWHLIKIPLTTSRFNYGDLENCGPNTTFPNHTLATCMYAHMIDHSYGTLSKNSTATFILTLLDTGKALFYYPFVGSDKNVQYYKVVETTCGAVFGMQYSVYSQYIEYISSGFYRIYSEWEFLSYNDVVRLSTYPIAGSIIFVVMIIAFTNVALSMKNFLWTGFFINRTIAMIAIYSPSLALAFTTIRVLGYVAIYIVLRLFPFRTFQAVLFMRDHLQIRPIMALAEVSFTLLLYVIKNLSYVVEYQSAVIFGESSMLPYFVTFFSLVLPGLCVTTLMYLSAYPLRYVARLIEKVDELDNARDFDYNKHFQQQWDYIQNQSILCAMKDLFFPGIFYNQHKSPKCSCLKNFINDNYVIDNNCLKCALLNVLSDTGSDPEKFGRWSSVVQSDVIKHINNYIPLYCVLPSYMKKKGVINWESFGDSWLLFGDVSHCDGQLYVFPKAFSEFRGDYKILAPITNMREKSAHVRSIFEQRATKNKALVYARSDKESKNVSPKNTRVFSNGESESWCVYVIPSKNVTNQGNNIVSENFSSGVVALKIQKSYVQGFLYMRDAKRMLGELITVFHGETRPSFRCEFKIMKHAEEVCEKTVDWERIGFETYKAKLVIDEELSSFCYPKERKIKLKGTVKHFSPINSYFRSVSDMASDCHFHCSSIQGIERIGTEYVGYHPVEMAYGNSGAPVFDLSGNFVGVHLGRTLGKEKGHLSCFSILNTHIVPEMNDNDKDEIAPQRVIEVFRDKTGDEKILVYKFFDETQLKLVIPSKNLQCIVSFDNKAARDKYLKQYAKIIKVVEEGHIADQMEVQNFPFLNILTWYSDRLHDIASWFEQQSTKEELMDELLEEINNRKVNLESFASEMDSLKRKIGIETLLKCEGLEKEFNEFNKDRKEKLAALNPLRTRLETIKNAVGIWRTTIGDMASDARAQHKENVDMLDKVQKEETAIYKDIVKISQVALNELKNQLKEINAGYNDLIGQVPKKAPLAEVLREKGVLESSIDLFEKLIKTTESHAKEAARIKKIERRAENLAAEIERISKAEKKNRKEKEDGVESEETMRKLMKQSSKSKVKFVDPVQDQHGVILGDVVVHNVDDDKYLKKDDFLAYLLQYLPIALDAYFDKQSESISRQKRDVLEEVTEKRQAIMHEKDEIGNNPKFQIMLKKLEDGLKKLKDVGRRLKPTLIIDGDEKYSIEHLDKSEYDREEDNIDRQSSTPIQFQPVRLICNMTDCYNNDCGKIFHCPLFVESREHVCDRNCLITMTRILRSHIDDHVKTPVKSNTEQASDLGYYYSFTNTGQITLPTTYCKAHDCARLRNKDENPKWNGVDFVTLWAEMCCVRSVHHGGKCFANFKQKYDKFNKIIGVAHTEDKKEEAFIDFLGRKFYLKSKRNLTPFEMEMFERTLSFLEIMQGGRSSQRLLACVGENSYGLTTTSSKCTKEVESCGCLAQTQPEKRMTSSVETKIPTSTTSSIEKKVEQQCTQIDQLTNLVKMLVENQLKEKEPSRSKKRRVSNHRSSRDSTSGSDNDFEVLETREVQKKPAQKVRSAYKNDAEPVIQTSQISVDKNFNKGIIEYDCATGKSRDINDLYPIVETGTFIFGTLVGRNRETRLVKITRNMRFGNGPIFIFRNMNRFDDFYDLERKLNISFRDFTSISAGYFDNIVKEQKTGHGSIRRRKNSKDVSQNSSENENEKKNAPLKEASNSINDAEVSRKN